MSNRMSSPPSRPMIAIALAGLVLAGTSACASDYEDNVGVQCVKKVNANDPDDDVEVEVVDPRMCDTDGVYNHSHGGYPVFISSGGGYYGTPVGTRYVHSSYNDGGRPLISSTNTAARTSAGFGSSTFKSGVTGGKTTVKGSFGSSGKAGGGG